MNTLLSRQHTAYGRPYTLGANVVPAPACIGVATLDYDHTHILGNTLAEIAFEKAGVFKPGIPCFSVPQPSEAMAVLRQCATQVGCDLCTVRPE